MDFNRGGLPSESGSSVPGHVREALSSAVGSDTDGMSSETLDKLAEKVGTEAWNGLDFAAQERCRAKRDFTYTYACISRFAWVATRQEMYIPLRHQKNLKDQAFRNPMEAETHMIRPLAVDQLHRLLPGAGAGLSDSRSQSRPTAPTRTSTSDATTIEKIWGRFFNKETQQPNPRLGQFLRGIALHIVS